MCVYFSLMKYQNYFPTRWEKLATHLCFVTLGLRKVTELDHVKIDVTEKSVRIRLIIELNTNYWGSITQPPTSQQSTNFIE